MTSSRSDHPRRGDHNSRGDPVYRVSHDESGSYSACVLPDYPYGPTRHILPVAKANTFIARSPWCRPTATGGPLQREMVEATMMTLVAPKISHIPCLTQKNNPAPASEHLPNRRSERRCSARSRGGSTKIDPGLCPDWQPVNSPKKRDARNRLRESALRAIV